MKLSGQEAIEAHAAATRRGALEGVIGGGAVGFSAAYYANKVWPAYRRLPLSLKAFGIVLIAAPSLSIQAERRGLEFEHSQWEGEGLRIIDRKQLEREKAWEALPLKEKIGSWAYSHQYSLIMGSWAASLGVAALIISRNKYQTYPQKIVQARMWAQGLTVGLLIAAGALTHSRKLAEAKEGHADHSWRDVIEQQEEDRKHTAELAAAARARAPVAA